MRSMRTLRLQWPSTVEPKATLSAMRALSAGAGTPLMLEARAERPAPVQHRIAVAEGRAPGITAQLRAAISGLGIEGVSSEQPVHFTHAVEIRLSSRFRSLRVDHAEDINRSVLTALNRIGRGEVLSLQWWLMSPLQPTPVASKAPISTDSWTESLLRAPFAPPREIDSEARTALRAKRTEAGWRAIGRIAVRTGSEPRARQLIGGVADALRTAQAPGVSLSLHRLRDPNRLPRRASLRLNLAEVAAVAGWPVGRTSELPVLRLGSRRMPAAHEIASSGRVLGISSWPGKKRPLALSEDDSTRHLGIYGPTGTGKSTMALNLIAADMAAGLGVAVIEPSGDLIKDVLARVPKQRLGDVVYLDPTDDDAAVGINPLHGDPKTAELRADQLLSTLHNLYAANWGPRTSDILHAALLTLARTPGMSLAALPLLLSDARFRRSLIGDLNDPLGLGPFWASFHAWSEAERTTAIAPVMNKLRPFLVRERLRHIIGQATPRFDLGTVFSERRILLVNLARGELGPEAADLLGALVLSGLWQQAQGRAALPADQRPMVSIVLEEFPTYLSLPVDLGDALARGRALGISFTLIAQHLGQMDERMRAAVLSNVRSQVCFQLSPKDASLMAGTSTLLGAEDFASLGQFHFYARLMGESAVRAWCSGVSMPAPKTISDATRVRDDARSRYAVPSADVDAALTALFQPAKSTPGGDDFGPRKRKAGGAS
ncbi:MAG: hypothetical protein JWM34_471 [Ilumatobacteraceae bacterium]|nr:hypothetical protein [Ilumatobacteraceae bacterium]